MTHAEMNKKEAAEFASLPVQEKLKIIIDVCPHLAGKLDGMSVKNGEKVSSAIISWVKNESSRLEKMDVDMTDDQLDELDEVNNKLAQRVGIELSRHFSENPYMQSVV